MADITQPAASPVRVEDTHVREFLPLLTPSAVKAVHPNQSAQLIAQTRQEIADVIHGNDSSRLVIVVGPCSIHDVAAAYDYAQRLVELRHRYEEELVIVMRTYFEKPRTTVGWTGLVYDPHLDGSEDIPAGIDVSRRLLVDINRLGMPCAVELLDPITPQFYADLVAWAAIGARTVESQVHRQLASGLSMPVGFKNSTDGRVKVAVQAMEAAARPHSFFGITTDGEVAMVRTEGNPDTHIVLRGGTAGPNFDALAVEAAVAVVAGRQVARPIMVDCSHGNSLKDHHRQTPVARDVLAQVRAGRNEIMGLMIESHLSEGRQDWKPNTPLAYGRSITDACIGWDETAALLEECASAVRGR
ncbi:MAG: 3-deoxy-7-phosphoheptulonate synthase [Acidimicrobiia bacterium]|nr:3-deoxy-7-phosphoheptulonate synthase [Acidimicrobiia bacterium]